MSGKAFRIVRSSSSSVCLSSRNSDSAPESQGSDNRSVRDQWLHGGIIIDVPVVVGRSEFDHLLRHASLPPSLSPPPPPRCHCNTGDDDSGRISDAKNSGNKSEWNDSRDVGDGRAGGYCVSPILLVDGTNGKLEVQKFSLDSNQPAAMKAKPMAVQSFNNLAMMTHFTVWMHKSS